MSSGDDPLAGRGKALSARQHLFQSASVGLCYLDRDLRIRHLNDRMAAVNGRTVQEHLGRPIREMIPDMADQVEPLYRRVIETGEALRDVEFTGPTPMYPGQLRHWVVSYMPHFGDDGQVHGVSTVIQDVTERRRAEDAMRESETRMRRLLETTNVIPWEADAVIWRFTYVGPQAVRLLGYALDRWYLDDFWTSHIHPEDRAHAVQYCRQSAEVCDHYDFEYRMIAADGRIVWLHDVVSASGKPGARKLRGFMIDITERKLADVALLRSEAALRSSHAQVQELAGRLITAQEEERRRLARELHDDLTQRLAVLAIETGKLEQQLPADAQATRAALHRITDEVGAISSDVHGISRRLHPSILDDLGLLDALRSACGRYSERHAVPVRFRSDLVVPLPREVELGLYRVAQEALRNIAKHAEAQNIEMEIESDDEGVRLLIRDDGVGFFAPEAARRGGIGLASMEERIRLLAGSFVVRSRPGQGTEVEVRVPRSAWPA